MKWTVGTKIGSGFGLGLLILMVIGAASFYGTAKLTETAFWVDHTHKVLEDLAGVIQGMTDAETGMRGYAVTGQEPYLEPYQTGTAAVERNLKEVRQLTSDNHSQQVRLDSLEPLAAQAMAWMAEVNDAVKAKGPEAGRQLIATGKGKQLMDAVRGVIEDMRTGEKGEIPLLKNRTDAADASVQALHITIIGGTIAAIVVLTLAAFIITRNISIPLKEITATAERIAEGDLSVKVFSNQRRDEVGVLAQTFSRMSQSLREMAGIAEKIAAGDLRVKVKPQSSNDVLGNAFASMVENLRRMIGQFSETVNVLSSSANQISTSTTQLAAGAAETATAVSQATTTVEEVRQTAQLASQKAKLVSDNAQKMTQISQTGTKSTNETVAGMNRIRQQVESIANTMVRLSEQGQTIGQIVTTVEDLAAQSNLLAVNASIEAAKAGEQGRGFAVVAQEVRSLAEQSKQATNQVKGILGDIQKATSAAVMATEQGSKAVESGVLQAGQSGESIQALSSSVNEAAQAATQIAASSQQQLVGVDQVASAMENIKQASTQNVASAKQLEAAAHNLNDLGHKLKQTMEQYKT
jgi:methyl-accepting chemotaxis protein